MPVEHRQSQESLTENANGGKQKRKAPVLLTNTTNQENITESGKSRTFCVLTLIERVTRRRQSFGNGEC